MHEPVGRVQFVVLEKINKCLFIPNCTRNAGHCSQIFKFRCDIQGSHLIGYLWVSLIIDQSECLICFFLCTELTLFCTELTLFCTELPENCIYLNQSELSNFSMYIINYSNCTDPRQHGTYWYFFKGAKKCWGHLCVCPPPDHDMVSWITPAKTCRRNSTYHVKYYYLHRQ